MDARAHPFSTMEAERKFHDDFDIDDDFRVTVTESGQTAVHNSDASDPLDDMDFSILASGRTMETIDRPAGKSDRLGLRESSSKDASSDLDSQSHMKTNQSIDQRQRQQHQSESFQPLLPLPDHPTRPRSAPRAIPNSKPPTAQIQTQGTTVGPPASQPSSAGSTASAFLNNLLDPAASTFNNTQISHTPPNQIATSYEASHFGKRARSGSVSERLKVSTELEQRGMIDREQKGILKDLIISGQDNEIQHALDRYEEGDTALLEAMLQNGSLSNKAKTEIDLLGDLDLDFLNVTDPGMRDITSQNIAYAGSSNPMNSPSTQPRRDPTHATVTFEASDGIGELDFDGEIGGADTFGPMNTNYRVPSPVYNPGQRSRSNSTFSVDLDYRQRSNSLFSALIGNVTPQGGTPVEYGRWMEAQGNAERQDPLRHNNAMIDRAERRASAPEVLSNLSITMAKEEKKLTASQRKELKAEEKRRERIEKKEQKERDKQEKKEKREQAKLDKQKKVEDDEKEEHEPGSGMPRSMSDPNIRTSIVDGLLHVERPDGWIGAYSPESRRVRILRFLEKRNHRVWTKTVKYDVRKNFADSRLRVKGRFVKKEDELLMRELMSLT